MIRVWSLIRNLVNFGEYFGPLHIHQTSGAPKNYPELHIVYKKPERAIAKYQYEDRLSSKKLEFRSLL